VDKINLHYSLYIGNSESHSRPMHIMIVTPESNQRSAVTTSGRELRHLTENGVGPMNVFCARGGDVVIWS
jgi:hypothetical protein